MSDLMDAAAAGDKREFEYLMHQWQDSYVHWDRGYRGDGGHWRPSVDERNDPTNMRNRAYERCDLTTRRLEQVWFALNPEDFIEAFFDNPTPSFLQQNAWLAVGPYLWVTDDEGNVRHITGY